METPQPGSQLNAFLLNLQQTILLATQIMEEPLRRNRRVFGQEEKIWELRYEVVLLLVMGWKVDLQLFFQEAQVIPGLRGVVDRVAGHVDVDFVDELRGYQFFFL